MTAASFLFCAKRFKQEEKDDDDDASSLDPSIDRLWRIDD